jgi:hypothetical protein
LFVLVITNEARNRKLEVERQGSGEAKWSGKGKNAAGFWSLLRSMCTCVSVEEVIKDRARQELQRAIGAFIFNWTLVFD